MTTRDITSPSVRKNKVMYELVKKEHIISHMSNTILKYVPRYGRPYNQMLDLVEDNQANDKGVK